MKEIRITKGKFEENLEGFESWDRTQEVLQGSQGDIISNWVYYYYDKDSNLIGKWSDGTGTIIPIFKSEDLTEEDEKQIKREHSLSLMFDEDLRVREEKRIRLFSKYLYNKYRVNIFITYEDGEIIKFDQKGW